MFHSFSVTAYLVSRIVCISQSVFVTKWNSIDPVNFVQFECPKMSVTRVLIFKYWISHLQSLKSPWKLPRFTVIIQSDQLPFIYAARTNLNFKFTTLTNIRLVYIWTFTAFLFLFTFSSRTSRKGLKLLPVWNSLHKDISLSRQ